MADENNYILKGKLYGEPRPGFNYAEQRAMITVTLLTGKEKQKPIIRQVFNFEVKKEGEFECKCRCDGSISSMYEGLTAEKTKVAVLKDIQSLFGIGQGFGDQGAYENKRLELEKIGVFPLSYISDFEKEKKDEKS